MALRIRGKPLDREPTATVSDWEAAVMTMLEHARRYGELDQRHELQKAWFGNPKNYDHPAWNERKTMAHLVFLDRNKTAGAAMDQAVVVSRLQRGLPDDLRGGLEALCRRRLDEAAPQAWVMAAKHLRTNDFYRVVFAMTVDNEQGG